MLKSVYVDYGGRREGVCCYSDLWEVRLGRRAYRKAFHEGSELQPKVPRFYTTVQIAIRFVSFLFCAKSILGYESSILLLLLHSIVLEIHFLFPVYPAFSNMSIAVVNKHGWARIFVSLSFAAGPLHLLEQHLENGDAATGLLFFAHLSLFFLGALYIHGYQIGLFDHLCVIWLSFIRRSGAYAQTRPNALYALILSGLKRIHSFFENTVDRNVMQ